MIPTFQNIKVICEDQKTPWFIIFNIWHSPNPFLKALEVDNLKNVP